MKVESVKLILDVCAEAAHIEQLLPELPQGITPRCVRVIEQIAKLSKEHRDVRVSDISEMLDVTRPGITAVLRELTEMGYVTKSRDDVDSRVVLSVYLFVLGNIEFVLTMLGLCCSLEVARTSGLQSPISC